MKNISILVVGTLLCASYAGSASARTAGQNAYTNDEQTLCQPDVFRLCNDYVPDEDRIIACMKANRKALSPECRKVFEAGMKKRGE